MEDKRRYIEQIQKIEEELRKALMLQGLERRLRYGTEGFDLLVKKYIELNQLFRESTN